MHRWTNRRVCHTPWPLPLTAAACLGLAVLAGCAVGPNFKKPAPAVPPAWAGPAVAATQPTTAPEAAIDLARWWTAFNDPTLNSLIERAAGGNLDLRSAEARLRQARASRGIAVAGLFPTVGANGSLLRNRSAGAGPSGPVAMTRNLYQLGLDASWELDVFGGVRRNIESADANIQAAVEDRRDVLVTVLAEVSLNYVDLRGFQQQALIAQDNLRAQRHSAELTRKRFGVGLVGQLDVANADAQVASTAAVIPLLESSAAQAIYSLGVLLGQPPAALLEELGSASRIPASPPEVPLGLPSELLRRRPDIRRAEAQIHAATAQIGVATADLFPQFTLNATMGFTSGQFRTLTDAINRVWTLNPAGNWTLFDGGRILSNIEVQKALTDQAVVAYQQVVLTALQDVENALVAYDKERDRHKALIDAVAANRKAVDAATRLYTQGQTDFLNVLVAQGALFASEDALVQSTRALSTDLVALYKALGGGWELDAGPAGRERKLADTH